MRSISPLDVPHGTFSGIPNLWLCPHRVSRTPLRDTLLHGLLVVGEGEQIQVVARWIHLARRDQCHIVVLVLFNIIIYNKFNLESNVDDLIFFNLQLFNAESPTPRWEDVGSFNLDGAMAVAKDITTAYTQVVFF